VGCGGCSDELERIGDAKRKDPLRKKNKRNILRIDDL
jgi:hypothetical protein